MKAWSLNNGSRVLWFGLIAFVVNYLSLRIESTFLGEFLGPDLLSLLLALLAINLTNVSFILTKLRELSDKHGANFKDTIDGIRESVTEQVILLLLAVIALIIQSSKTITTEWPDVIQVSRVVLITLLFMAVYILIDTARATFQIAKTEDNLRTPLSTPVANQSPSVAPALPAAPSAAHMSSADPQPSPQQSPPADHP